VTNYVIVILRKQMKMASESNNENSNYYKVLQLTTSALIDAYHNESSLWDSSRNASEEEKELAWARISTLFNTRPGMNGFERYSRLRLYLIFLSCCYEKRLMKTEYILLYIL